MERIKNEIFLNSLFTFRHENIRFNILLMSSIEVTDFLIEQLNKYYKSYQDAKFIWRDECLFCYDNSKNSSEEYYICLSSYLGFCARHVKLYLTDQKKFFVAVKCTEILQTEPTAQIPTQMGIGIEGGFNIQNKNFKEDFYLVVGDTVRGISKINYDPNFLPNDINILINTGYLSMNRCSQVIPWSDSEVTLSKSIFLF
uniref:Ubiquitin carboxyl-terminal hydrolase 5 (Trinotate prediction) n=1 Tax=Henneguya salminicola TaxID=69463 RepID=A0A6G3MFI0_HENSL